MLFEFSLEPALLSSYGNCCYLLERFGISQGRLVVQFPSKWFRLVYQSLPGTLTDQQRARVEVLLSRMKGCAVGRGAIAYNQDQSWLQNAEVEHLNRQFRAIIAQENPRNQEFVLQGPYLDAGNALWSVPRDIDVARTPEAIAGAVKMLLRISNDIAFVDPHFGPENARYRRTLVTLVAAAVFDRQTPPQRITYFTGTGAEDEFFLNECRQRLPTLIPKGTQVRFVKLVQRDGGERLHNRYVLTEKGGISFGIGLDAGDQAQTDDVRLLDDALYIKRWRNYVGPDPAFDIACEVTIVGAKP
jgi:hypothetical protein